jgi:16S rRNA G966 N2-methylase RsmD
MNRYRPGVSFPYNPLSGTLYIASQTVESNIFEAFVNKVNKLLKAFYFVRSHNLISIGSTKQNNINNNSIDYIFTDPPFGSNIYVFGAEFSLGKLAKSKNQ